MRYLLVSLCRNSLLRNRQACLWCALVVLSLLALLLIWPIAKPKKPTVYSILDLGGIKEGQDITAKEHTYRLAVFRDPSVLGEAIKDVEIAGEKIHKPDAVDGVKWLRERLRVESLGKLSRVRVWLVDGAPVEQAVIVNAVLRAYVRFFTVREQNLLNSRLAADRGRILREALTTEPLASELRRGGREEHNRLVKQLLTDRLDPLKAARKQELRATVGALPVVVEWAQTP